MSPKVRFRRGLLKYLYLQNCHSIFFKKVADWYFGKLYSFWNYSLRKLKNTITTLSLLLFLNLSILKIHFSYKYRHLHDVCLCGIHHPFFLILLFYNLFQLFSNFLILYLDAKLLKPSFMQMLICFC
mgnify:CR=1 FL=1